MNLPRSRLLLRNEFLLAPRPAWHLSISTQPFHSRLGEEVRSPTARPNHAQCVANGSRYRAFPGSRPALERIERSLAEARKRKESPAGRIRLIIPRTAAYMVLLPKLAQFARTYTEIVLEVTSSNDPVDLVAGEYDAGIQIGEFIQRDMIAVRVSKDLRLAVVGSPEYFKSCKIPRTPRDLKDHACIGFRFSSGIYRWEFEKGRKTVTVNPQGPVTFDDSDLVVRAVLNGVGIGTAVEESLAEMIAKGRLVQALRDWCPTFPGYFLYYPSRRNQPAALTALINTLRLSQ